MGLGWIDLLVLAGYFAITLGLGFWVGRGEKSTLDFFLGGRRQHWLLAGMSIIATEVSALTVIAVPADAFKSDWSYVQMYAGSFVGRVLIVLLLLPAFYRGGVTTVYEYLGQRFGPWTRTTASLMFFASRIIGSGIRLLVASLAVAQVFDWPLVWVVIGAAGVAIAYATFGGIKSILWTDAFQAIVFLAAAGAVIVFLFGAIPGGWAQNLGTAYEAGKLHAFTWDFDLNNDKVFWVLTVHAVFVTMTAMGTDQDLTQRMLTCPDVGKSQRSLLFNAFAGLPIVCTFLLIGSLLFVYYAARPEGALPANVADSERVFPFFIATALPDNAGLKGLLIAAIFAAAMSSLSSAVGALSSTAVTDLYRPLTANGRSERHYLVAARVGTFAFGAVLVVVALGFAGKADLLWAVFKWVSLVFGGMLGIFLLGVLTKRRGRDGFNALVMVSSVALLVVIMLIDQHYQRACARPFIAWPWWVVIGTVWTFVVASVFRTRRVR